MKKMLLLTRKYPPSVGGMENAIYNIAHHLSDTDLEVKVVSLGKSQKNLIWFFPYIQLYTLINARRYDYLFLGDALICICGALARMVNPSIRRMILLHGLDVTYSNPWYQFYLRRFLKKAADIYACNSNYTKGVAISWGLKERVVATSLGVDVDKYQDATITSHTVFLKRYNIPEQNLILITSGRLVKRKGVEWLIRNVLPSINNVTYLVIGDGEERENVMTAIQDTHSQDKVFMLGRISDKELVDCYHNADVFVMPNFHVEDNAEGFGLVALEASLAGLIVLASNVDGIPDAVQHEKNGYLLESLNSKQYISYIRDIQDNRVRYKEAARQFQKYTYNNCSWNDTCMELKKLLSSKP